MYCFTLELSGLCPNPMGLLAKLFEDIGNHSNDKNNWTGNNTNSIIHRSTMHAVTFLNICEYLQYYSCGGVPADRKSGV